MLSTLDCSEIIKISEQLRACIISYESSLEDSVFMSDERNYVAHCHDMAATLVESLRTKLWNPNDEAEILYSAMMGLQVGIRRDDLLRPLVRRSKELLPQVTDPRHHCRLMIVLSAVIHSDHYLDQINDNLYHLTTEEDPFFIELFTTIKEEQSLILAK